MAVPDDDEPLVCEYEPARPDALAALKYADAVLPPRSPAASNPTWQSTTGAPLGRGVHGSFAGGGPRSRRDVPVHLGAWTPAAAPIQTQWASQKGWQLEW